VARGTVSSAHDVGAASESPPPSEVSNDPSLDDPSLDDPSLDDPSLDAPSLDAPSLDAPSLDAPSLEELPSRGAASVEASTTVPSWLVWPAPSALASPPAAASPPEDDASSPPHATSWAVAPRSAPQINKRLRHSLEGPVNLAFAADGLITVSLPFAQEAP